MWSRPVWLITGANSGLGLTLTKHALHAGARVIGTVRNPDSDMVVELKSLGASIIVLDVNSGEANIGSAMTEAEAMHGHIDVLVNNAGRSVLGAIEDMSIDQAHSQFETNFFGPYALIRAVIPGMRKRKSGTIVNVTSVAGIDGLPSCGLYAASKFALEGLSESLQREMEPHGVSVLIVEPGAFRTNFLNAFEGIDMSTPYKTGPVADVLEKFTNWSGKQPGDPAKAAKAIYDTVQGLDDGKSVKGKSLRLPLGKDCRERVEAKIKSLQGTLDATTSIALKTGFEESK